MRKGKWNVLSSNSASRVDITLTCVLPPSYALKTRVLHLLKKILTILLNFFQLISRKQSFFCNEISEWGDCTPVQEKTYGIFEHLRKKLFISLEWTSRKQSFEDHYLIVVNIYCSRPGQGPLRTRLCKPTPKELCKQRKSIFHPHNIRSNSDLHFTLIH